MLSESALGMVMSVARGIVKLAGRLDLLMAEKAGVEGPLVIPMPVMTFPTVPFLQRVTALEGYLKDTLNEAPDPLGARRADLAAAIRDRTDEVDVFFAQTFPDRAGVAFVDPDDEFIKALRARLPDLDLDNRETRLAAFYLSAGKDARGIGYITRTALLVADVVAEFGVEHASQFISHQPTRDLVTSIVGRFAKPDLESFTEWGPLLRQGLASALEGLIDSKAAIEGSAPWLDAVLSALATAQEDPEGGADFVTGLVNGKGYQLLFSKGLLLAADRLAPEGAGPYKDIAADVLRGAAPIVKARSASFRTFFNDNWGELLRAGLNSVDKHGPMLLAGENPLVRDVTLALIKELAQQQDLTRLSSETVFNLADAAIGVAAKNPALLAGGRVQPWLKEYIVAALKVVDDEGARKTLGTEGVEQVLLKALGVLGANPELLADKPGVRVELVGSVLKAVSVAGAMDARTLGIAAVTGILERLASNPNLARTRYPEILAALVGDLAKQVTGKNLTSVQATVVLHSAAEAVLRNPALFERLDGKVASAVLSGVIKGAGTGTSGLIAGTTLVAVLDEVFQTVARHGQPLLDEVTDAEALATKLSATFMAGLTLAEAELGRRMDGSNLPRMLAALLAAVARGQITQLDPDSIAFREAFAGLVEAAV